ncbi:MAG: CoA transferase, partial [Actinomycetota bacterium]|nr:CoA transferase [Actinomycetota bacterium]
YGLFRCRDGAVKISVVTEKIKKRLSAAFGIDGLGPGLASNAERVANRERVIELVEAAFAAYDREPLLARLAEINVPAGKVRRIDEVYEWEQTRSQGLLVEVEHETLGPLTLPGPPLRFFAADGAETSRRGQAAPPVLDSDGAAIRAWLAGPDEPGNGATARQG